MHRPETAAEETQQGSGAQRHDSARDQLKKDIDRWAHSAVASAGMIRVAPRVRLQRLTANGLSGALEVTAAGVKLLPCAVSICNMYCANDSLCKHRQASNPHQTVSS